MAMVGSQISNLSSRTDAGIFRILEDESGYKLDVKRTVKAPSEALQNHVNAVREFKGKVENHLLDFEQEANTQQVEITDQIQHGEFFLEEFRHHQWNANPMFDRLRIHYIGQVDSLRRERRQLRKEVIFKKITFEEKLLDAKKELSPFSRLF